MRRATMLRQAPEAADPRAVLAACVDIYRRKFARVWRPIPATFLVLISGPAGTPPISQQQASTPGRGPSISARHSAEIRRRRAS